MQTFKQNASGKQNASWRRCVLIGVAGVMLATTPAIVTSAPARANVDAYRSVELALEQGIGAYNGGYFEIAVPALEYASANNSFMAHYFLARLYSNNDTVLTDHAKAFLLYQRIANDFTDVDPDDPERAPYVADALVKLAKYLRFGLSEIGLKEDPARAAEYLHHAAVFFNSADAQFVLSKMKLVGDGIPADTKLALYWLEKLANRGHAGAQAFMADLYWRGKYVEKDQLQALAFIWLAVKNAPPAERVWIEDIYQNIYCGAPMGVRKQVGGMVAEWDKRYGRRPMKRLAPELGVLDARPVRTCENGDELPVLPLKDVISVQPSRSAPPVMRGSTLGLGQSVNVKRPGAVDTTRNDSTSSPYER